MSERTTGTTIGGILALIGAIIGFLAAWMMLGFKLETMLSPPTLWLLLVVIGSILGLIFAIMLLIGKVIKWSAILLIIGGLLSIIAGIGGYFGFLAGILEILGAIIALLLKK